MRTVTFSEAGIVKVLGDTFVCAWVNKRPDLKFKDDLYGTCWVPRGLRNGAAAANVTSVFAAADGTLIHAVAGYADAAAFKRHLQFAQDLHAKYLTARPGDRTHLVLQAHRDAAKTAKTHEEKWAHEQMAKQGMTTRAMPVDFFDSVGNIFA